MSWEWRGQPVVFIFSLLFLCAKLILFRGGVRTNPRILIGSIYAENLVATRTLCIIYKMERKKGFRQRKMMSSSGYEWVGKLNGDPKMRRVTPILWKGLEIWILRNRVHAPFPNLFSELFSLSHSVFLLALLVKNVFVALQEGNKVVSNSSYCTIFKRTLVSTPRCLSFQSTITTCLAENILPHFFSRFGRRKQKKCAYRWKFQFFTCNCKQTGSKKINKFAFMISMQKKAFDVFSR